MHTNLPQLRQIPLSKISSLSLPSLKIQTDDDVEQWKNTQSYLDYGVFLRRLNESVVGYYLPWEPESYSQSIDKILKLLDVLNHWIDEIPPLQTPQRFGNLAFRTWGKRLEERCDQLLEDLLAPSLSATLPYIKPYLLLSFGSFTRMDYGTGHESCFSLFLLCLTLLRFFDPNPEEERDLVLSVFLRYLKLCWRLQDQYRLEPAGSHGVWGLDDYCFLPYIFGSGQLRDQTDIPVSSILRPPLPPTNMYFMSIMRIHDVKYGPFHEHSSQLHSIAAGVPNWGKVNSGLFKMFEAEVLGKRVVVQHIPLGGLLEWESAESNPDACAQAPTTIAQSWKQSSSMPSTMAPWAPATAFAVQRQTNFPSPRHIAPTNLLPSSRPSRDQYDESESDVNANKRLPPLNQ